MKKKILLRSIVLLTSCFASVLYAAEFRSPIVCERGSLRHVFEEWSSEDYGFQLWASGYGREAHKAFKSHGTGTQPLTSLFFNKADFRLSEIFPNSLVKRASEFYNPFVRVLKISPRASYTEKGVFLGFKFAYPIYKNKGRLGVRASIPFRAVEIEKQDSFSKDDAQLKDLAFSGVKTELIKIDGTKYSPKVEAARAFAVRWDFLEAISKDKFRSSYVVYNGTNSDGKVQLGGAHDMNDTSLKPMLGGVTYCPEGQIPRPPARRVAVPGYSTVGTAGTVDAATAMPVAGNILDGRTNVYGFEHGTADKYKYWEDEQATNVTNRLNMQAKKANMWLVSAHKFNDGKLTGDADSGSQQVYESLFMELFNQYPDNALEWMADRGFEFMSSRRAGLGDIDMDLFYEHQFNEDFMGEVTLGVRFPTGGSSKFYTNPYHPNLGNGEHFEVKIGSMLAWQPLDWLNLKLTTRYSFVLETSEQRAAAFSGAQIKNIGPRADADVDWGYFVGQLDFNIFHPKTDAISALIGYEFYYKTKDNVNFKKTKMQSWLGKEMSTTTAVFATAEYNLSNSLAEKNTEAIGHKIRVESSFRISKWFELFFGGSYTIAGQNLPREMDGHAGFVVEF